MREFLYEKLECVGMLFYISIFFIDVGRRRVASPIAVSAKIATPITYLK